MIRIRASRRNLFALAFATALALASSAPVEAARRLEPRRNPTVEPRQAEPAQQGLWNVLWSFFTAVWGRDGSHLDPNG
jgi:hypothetical protein